MSELHRLEMAFRGLSDEEPEEGEEEIDKGLGGTEAGGTEEQDSGEEDF